MLWLLLTVALAQEPQAFDPVPADVDGKAGILVDEETFAELIALREAVKTKDVEIAAFEEWQAAQKDTLETSLLQVRETCEDGQDRLVAHYEKSLKREKRKDWLQRHAFPAGVAVGLVGATVAYLGATHFYGEVLTVSVDNR
jgi:hypothetical protein